MAINLLPPSEKHNLSLDTLQKKLSLFLFFGAFSLFCLFGMFFGIKFSLSQKTEQIKMDVSAREKEIAGVDFQSFKKAIAETNQQIAKISKFWDQQIFITPLLDQLAATTPQSIYFTNLSFKKAENTGFVNIRGLAQTRDALFYFKQNIEKLEGFKEVVFPPSAWVKPVNVDFSFTFQYDFSQK